MCAFSSRGTEGTRANLNDRSLSSLEPRTEKRRALFLIGKMAKLEQSYGSGDGNDDDDDHVDDDDDYDDDDGVAGGGHWERPSRSQSSSSFLLLLLPTCCHSIMA